VVLSDPSHESLFKWISKGANGTTMKGVFYRSNAVKPSANKLDFKLYRTHELASSGTLDLFAKIAFPSNIKASDARDAILTCGTATYSSVASTSDQTTTTLSIISFSLPKSTFVGKVTTCSVKTNIGDDTYSADNIKVEPKATDSKIDVAATVSKQSTDPKTMIIQTTIK
jgi:hypothetical protein